MEKETKVIATQEPLDWSDNTDGEPVKVSTEEPIEKVQIKITRKTIGKDEAIAVVDKVIAQSSRLLSSGTIRSAEARAMLNGVKDEIDKL